MVKLLDWHEVLVDGYEPLKKAQRDMKQQQGKPKPQQQVTRQAPAAPNLAAVVTASEIEGVRNKIRPCWNTIGGARDQNLIVTLVVQMNQDGTPVKAELKDTGRYNNDPTGTLQYGLVAEEVSIVVKRSSLNKLRGWRQGGTSSTTPGYIY